MPTDKNMKYLRADGEWAVIDKAYKFLRADNTWAAASAEFKFLDATGAWSVPSLGPTIPTDFSSVQNVLDAAEAAKEQPDEVYAALKDKLVSINCGTYGTHNFRLVGVNHDDLVSGGKAGLSFFCEDCIGTSMLKSGDSSNSNGFPSHNTTMMTYLTNVFNAMPQEWRSAIKAVKKEYGKSSSTKDTMTFNNLWLASMYEIGFTNSANSNYYEPDSGKTYAYFKDAPASGASPKRVRNNGSSAAYWWLRSGYFSGSNLFALVPTVGSLNRNYPLNTYGVVPGFCV